MIHKMNSPPLLLLIIFHFLSIVTSATNSSEISYEIDPFIRVYKNGTAQRLSGTQTVPPSLDPNLRVLSKDITIDPNLNVSARIFLPRNAAVSVKIPLLVYFHGGGFFIQSPFSPIYHNHLSSLVAEADVVAVSVNYRLAPEHPLPVAFQDSWLALNWIFSHCNGGGSERWLKHHVDFGRIYLGGDSAGANIAQNMAIRAGSEKLDRGINLIGMFLNCPAFWGKERIGSEGGDPEKVAWVADAWLHAYPDSVGLDDPLMNPGMDPDLWKLGCKKVLVYVAERDIFRDRGWCYGEVLKKSKWDGIVKVKEVKGEVHVFNLFSPNVPKARKMLNQLAFFLNSKENGKM